MRESFRISTVGFAPCGFDDIEHVQYDPPARSSLAGKAAKAVRYFGRDFESFYWTHGKTAIVDTLRSGEYDVIVANDVDTLPLALRIAGRSGKVHFDAHEYAPLEFEENLKWRILRQPLVTYLCRNYIGQAATASTVCRGISEKYREEFDKSFTVITNAAEFADLQPSATDPRKIGLIYHGGASESRQTHRQIEMMEFLDDRFELNLMVLGEPKYIERLKRVAEPFKNVRFLPPVPTAEIAKFTNAFDIGVYSLPPTNFNNERALPNKFFEFVQARLAVVIGPSPEMARLVREYDLGAVAEDFSPESMAEEIKALTAERIDHFKAQAHKHAYELSADKNRELFLNLFGC